MSKKVHSGLWTREEAFDYLNARFHMNEVPEKDQDKMIDQLCAMMHRPWCRSNLEGEMADEFGSDCTCDGPEKLGMIEPTTE